jgi:hypothetical protein
MQTLGLEVDFVNSVQVQPSLHAVCVRARLPARKILFPNVFLLCATNPVRVCVLCCVCVCVCVCV